MAARKLDPGHANDVDGYGPSHIRLGFDEWEFGFAYRRIHEGEDETSDAWATGRLCIMPNLFAPLHFEWRVPIDDHRTLSVVWAADPVSEERVPFRQDVVPSWWGRMHDDDGTPLTTHVLHQDTISWVGQGTIADRTREHLGRSDRGVQMFRKRLVADMDAVERGEDPSGLVRNPRTTSASRGRTGCAVSMTPGHDRAGAWTARIDRPGGAEPAGR